VKRYVSSARALLERLPLGLALRLLVMFFIRRVLAIPVSFSFAQTGEDRILSFFLHQRTGFYIDVGCNDPLKYSSTFVFYLKGWSGIAIDANEAIVDRFQKTRQQDVCIAAAVSDSERDVIFHRSESDTVSTIDEEVLEQWQDNWKFRPEDQVAVRTQTLTSILQKALPDQTMDIDFMTIDVEGHEFQVLSGLDFSRYRPKLISVEIHDLRTIFLNRIYLLLVEKGYSLVGYVTMNAYFLDDSAALSSEV
jgi:FkbM family methyltransferase